MVKWNVEDTFSWLRRDHSASKEDYMVSCAAECSGAVKGWGVQGQIKVLPEKPVIAFPPLCEMEATKVQRRRTPLGVRWWAV